MASSVMSEEGKARNFFPFLVCEAQFKNNKNDQSFTFIQMRKNLIFMHMKVSLYYNNLHIMNEYCKIFIFSDEVMNHIIGLISYYAFFLDFSFNVISLLKIYLCLRIFN